MILKKAQVGTTITWISATFILFFILAAYIAGVFIIVEGNSVEFSQIKISKDFAKKDFIQTQNVISFLDKNEKVISDWVDDEKIISHNDFINHNYDAESERRYLGVETVFNNFVNGINAEKPYICMQTDKKSIIA